MNSVYVVKTHESLDGTKYYVIMADSVKEAVEILTQDCATRYSLVKESDIEQIIIGKSGVVSEIEV